MLLDFQASVYRRNQQNKWSSVKTSFCGRIYVRWAPRLWVWALEPSLLHILYWTMFSVGDKFMLTGTRALKESVNCLSSSFMQRLLSCFIIERTDTCQAKSGVLFAGNSTTSGDRSLTVMLSWCQQSGCQQDVIMLEVMKWATSSWRRVHRLE